MAPEEPATPMRVSALLRRQAHDDQGRVLGRIADVETRRDGNGREHIVAMIVTAGRWGGLLGYERDERTGPWLLEHLARYVIRRHTIRVHWSDVHI